VWGQALAGGAAWASTARAPKACLTLQRTSRKRASSRASVTGGHDGHMLEAGAGAGGPSGFAVCMIVEEDEEEDDDEDDDDDEDGIATWHGCQWRT